MSWKTVHSTCIETLLENVSIPDEGIKRAQGCISHGASDQRLIVSSTELPEMYLLTSTNFSGLLVSHAGWTKPHCWCWECSKYSISEKRWPELPGNALMHQGTVAVAFNVRCKPLIRTAPTDFARLSGWGGPSTEA